ncbi:Ionotropic receptor 166 [Frankliniella occidentalis]|nr:Ionotropic receptor 166 [Frankliniella occidentalis]
MEAALAPVVFLLCCAAPGVRADLPVVDTAAPPEAVSAAALLTPFMAPQRATLVVLGRANWTGAFLLELAADVPRVLRPGFAERAAEPPQLEHALMSTRCAHLLPVDGLEDLLVALTTYDATTIPTRVLFWAAVAAPRDAVLQRVMRTRMWLGTHHYTLALNAPDGSVSLYKMTCDQVPATCRLGAKVITETDTWSPAEGRWLQGSAVFAEFCDWRPSRGGKSLVLTVFVLTPKDSRNASHVVELTKCLEHVAAGRRRRSLGAAVRFEGTSNYSRVHGAMKRCTLAAVLAARSLYGELSSTEVISVTAMKMAHVAVIVPAGLGATVSVMDAVTVEFSAMLWLGTGLAALCTVLVLTCTRRCQDVGGAVLQALAPMVGQAPPPPAPPRPMLAAWLLACVVLTAAYQGLLLGKLSSAVPRRELDSLRDVEDSGLPLKVLGNLAHSNVLTDNLASRAEYLVHAEIKAVIDTIATARNCALVAYLDDGVVGALRPFLLPPEKLHVIRLPYSAHNIIGMATKGSPLEAPLVRTLGLVEAAGLPKRWRLEGHERGRREHARRLASLREPRALALRHLHPAYVVLGMGHAASAAAFALEALCGAVVFGRG